MSSVNIRSTEDMIKEYLEEADALLVDDTCNITSQLHSHIMSAFRVAKDARESGGINKLMLDALRAYNSQYSRVELDKIESEGGSKIYMSLTATKCRAAMSWIKDVLLSAIENPWTVEPTPIPELPEEVQSQISEAVQREFESSLKNAEGQQDTLKTIKEINEFKRDLNDAILEEVNKEAKYNFKMISLAIDDKLKEGKWEKALSEFIDDFCVFPTAVLKGPIVTTQTKLKWVDGEPIETTSYVFVNKRVSPLDIYPAPEATSVNDGDFIEHLRLSRSEIVALKKLGSPYDEEAIERVLSSNDGQGLSNIDDAIETEKADEELRPNIVAANKNVFHGLHYFGAVEVKMLREWGKECPGYDDTDVLEIEAIVVGSEVIKVAINEDPLRRRPYYTASFQNRPGSIWGISLPYSMRDCQNMCNACARALDENMALSSGPQAEIYVDRLADSGDITEVHKRKIWQVTSDPMGAGGRAVTFFTVPSNAAELLAVYDKFEQKADDATMIPRYAYGNEKVGGAAQTSSGLGMLLESASKGIKDCIRHIDEGVIIPRIEYEFYHLMLEGNIKYSGDIEVVAMGSKTLTQRGAEQLRRQEFLNVISRPGVLKIIGEEGFATILRTMGKDLGFVGNIVPSRHELKLAKKLEAEQAQQNFEAQQQAKTAGATIQIEGQKEMHAGTLQVRMQELEMKRQKDTEDMQLKMADLEVRVRELSTKADTDLKKTAMAVDEKRETASKNIALSLQSGYEDKNNQT